MHARPPQRLLQQLGCGKWVAPRRAGRAGRLGVEVEEHGPGQVRLVVVGRVVRRAAGAHPADTGRYAVSGASSITARSDGATNGGNRVVTGRFCRGWRTSTSRCPDKMGY
jgi:hypothetical protein